ncbi:MAG: DHHW family protein [Vescimonas sp.]|uniref:DHHW family protein n=1 Tax=Vescimonas sp. TaxID=2892404 RepID=UPI002A909E28|nr:DHHW family protein [Vescimonas sp.]MDY5334965.1 DHHW family protein [Vescimonas sp.]
MSSRYERRRGSAGGAVLLLIAAAALVVAILAICTDIFSGKKAPDKDADTPPVTQTDGENTGDGTQSGDKQDTTGDTDNTDADNTGDGKSDVTTTKPASSNVITTSDKPYQSGGVYVVGSAGYEMYNYVGSLAEKYQSTVNAVADSLSGVSQVYAMAIPLSSGITLPDELFSDIPGSDQAQAEKDILAGMGQNVKTIPLHDVMMSHRTEYIYFRTDHHWTALGAYYAYVQFCTAKGITPHNLSDYEVSQFPGFLGSFYNDGGKPDAMKNDPDTVNAYHPVSATASMKYGDNENSTLTGGQVIFDESTASASLKYGTFIMGDNPFTVIENPEVSNGESCIVVKESFGNAFVPFLVDHYQTVYVVDYRYYSGSVTQLARDKGVKDILFVNNLSAIRGSYQMGKLAGVK